jgi:hypothetical protein
MHKAVLTAGVAVPFDDEARQRFTTSLPALTSALAGFGDQPSVDQIRALAELVRSLASAVARYDLADPAPDVDIAAARATLGQAGPKLTDAVVDKAWGDQAHRVLARAVVGQAAAVAGSTRLAQLELRMLAQGAPLSYALRRQLIADLGQLRQWLLVRLESTSQLTDCSVRASVAGVTLPPSLPEQPAGDQLQVGAGELNLMAVAAQALGSAVPRYVGAGVCASLLPPCGDCIDGDVLLARLELHDCAVLRVCTTERDQVLPGGAAYSAWAPILYRARALAEQACCQPDQAGDPTDRTLSYVDIQLATTASPTALDELLALLTSFVPAAVSHVDTAPAGGEPATPSAMWRELADLREQLGGMTATVDALRDQVREAQAAPVPDESDVAGAAAPAKAGPAKAGPAKVAPAKVAPAKKATRPQRPGQER